VTPVACLLCGERSAATVFTYDRPDAYEAAVGVDDGGYARAWVRCAACGFHYSRFSRDPEQLDRIYDQAYRDAASGFRSERSEAIFQRVVALPPEESESLQRVEAIKQAITRLQSEEVLQPWPQRPLRMLDVGGASGVFSYLFQDDVWRAEIVDPGQQGRFIEAHGVGYIQGRFESTLDVGPFHLISMNYLLEHVGDPRQLLATAHGHLHEPGLLYVEVPDELAFEHKPKQDDIFNACHLWMFGPSSLQQLLAEADFEPLTLTRGRSPRGHFALGILARAK